MRTLRIVVAYDGTDFHGWQIQPELRTVQGELQAALRTVTREPALTLTGAGRTDTGVHAEGQVASVRTGSTLPVRRLERSLEGLTGDDLAIREVADAPPDFHARASAIARIYRYRLLDRRSPLHRRTAVVPAAPLDVPRIARSLRALRGRHDFTSFAAAADETPSKVCDLRLLELARWSEGWELWAEADRFLHHMVRNLVGTLLEVGTGRRDPDALGAILDARDRTRAGPTAPAAGLTLVRVRYPETGAARVEGRRGVC